MINTIGYILGFILLILFSYSCGNKSSIKESKSYITMKIDASNLLVEDKFWKIIEESFQTKDLEEQELRLNEELAKLSEQEIFGFLYHYHRLSRISYTGDLWLVPYIVMGGCSDDGFDYFRDWLITRGKKVFFEALQNPDSLCEEFDKIAEGDIPEFEGLDYNCVEVLEDNFGKDFEEEEKKYDYNLPPQPEIIFNWDEDNEESMKKICPCVFEKWWDNDRF